MARDEATACLERLVATNRFTIAVVFPVVGATLVVGGATGYLPRALTFHPAVLLLGTAVMRLPLVAGVLPLIRSRTLLLLGTLSGYVYGIEAVGLATGLPYGEFSYGVELGPMLGGVPLALPLFFLPLLLNAVVLCSAILPPDWSMRRFVVFAVAIVVLIDLVLDPGAVALGFWTYVGSGLLYGVPLSNYLGWLLSGTVGVLVVVTAFEPAALRTRFERCRFLLDDLVSFVLFWGLVNLAFGNWVSVCLVACLGGLILAIDRSDRFQSPIGDTLPS